MKTRAYVSLLVGVVLAAMLVAPATHAAKKKPKKSGPVVVGTDEAGDWGCNQDCTLAPLGDALGQDLTEISIAPLDKATLNFVFKLNSLPPVGGVPEASRYNWDFTVDGEAFQLTGAFTEYARGICNPNVTGSCPPPRDPGSAPFFLRQGPCNVGAECTEVALFHAVFDGATATITVPIPLETIGAKPGSQIGPGVTSFGGTAYAAPSAFVSNTAAPADILTATITYKVPKK
jgi:hypothetical protein